MIRYENTTTAQRIAAYPRAVYRITIEREPLASLSFASGALSWRSVVRDVVDNSGNPAAFALGGSVESVLDADRVATLDFQAKQTAGNSVTVADLVNAVEGASRYARVIAVRRVPPIPGTSAGGADALAADRAAVNETELDRARANSPVAVIGGALRTVRTVAIVAVLIGAGVAAYRLFPSKASTGR